VLSPIVCTMFDVACASDGSVTIPAATKPNVHLLNFIGSASFGCLSVDYLCIFGGKNVCPGANPMHWPALIGTVAGFGNNYLSESAVTPGRIAPPKNSKLAPSPAIVSVAVSPGLALLNAFTQPRWHPRKIVCSQTSLSGRSTKPPSL
jgi:hypothetical protein